MDVDAATGRIRVWLEPGYDHGRYGAWLLDWPGSFTWGPTREGAMARVQSEASRHVRWLVSHGEPAMAPETDAMEVAEEVPATWLNDGYERNATFEADRAAVSDVELETAIRRLGHARADLTALIERVRAFERDGGALPLEERTDDAAKHSSPGRRSDEVLRHIATAEIWLASRLDRSLRYERQRAVEPVSDLQATRAWVMERLRELWARDAALSGTDGKGETWTLRKVLRRLLYHSLDHLLELDRRLAVAERRVDRLELRHDPPDLDALAELWDRSGFRGRASDRERMARSISGGAESWTLWDGPHLVAFARVLTDGAWFAHVSTVAVAPEWQGMGTGERLMRSLLEGREGQNVVLGARYGVEGFYRRFGFEPQPWLMARRRAR
jgi:ribosomal protein S18 acetylase RimI-like enzyme